MRAWHCSALSATLLLGACASGGGERPRAVDATAAAVATADAGPCRDYVAAWVDRFRGNVAQLDHGAQTQTEPLRLARERLAAVGVDEAACERPYCVIQPRGEGRLDSWCGYRRPDPSGRELYIWIPYR